MEDSGAEKRNDPLPQTPQGLGNSKAALEDALARVQRTLASGTVDSAHERASLHFAAANLLDRLDRYDEAFAQARLAHQERQVQYDPRKIERLVDEKIELFTRPTLRCLARASESSGKPVFIVGMPEAGTSVAGQILASHPLVHDAGELSWLSQIEHSLLHRTSDKERQTLDLRRCSLAVLDELAARYFRPLIALNPQASRTTDRLPVNFLNLGLISRLFPDARVIHCVRDPLDTCLSCYLTERRAGHEFCADLATLAHFYRQYRRLMDHWKQVLDHPILEVSYEAMLEDPEPLARRMLAFLGLPWDPQCYAQVCRWTECTSVGRSKLYSSHLGPLLSEMKQPATPPIP
ncbi:MAG TPA: sulfotransferase [Tepidisphaeraceae bacterium]|nr:sulfotransferase [Tepidisphaeraceae bacterium]